MNPVSSGTPKVEKAVLLLPFKHCLRVKRRGRDPPEATDDFYRLIIDFFPVLFVNS